MGIQPKEHHCIRHIKKSIKIDDRLKGTWTLGQYEKAYNKALYDAVKAADPNWKQGDLFDSSVLDSITRESVESQLIKSGSTFVKKPSSGSALEIVTPFSRGA